MQLVLSGLEEGNQASSEHCLVYLVCRSTSNPDVVHLTEGWTTEEDHHRLFAGDAAQAMVAKFPAATALELARRGIGVIATYRSHRTEGEETVARIRAEGGRAVALPLDLDDTSSLDGFVASVVDALEATWVKAPELAEQLGQGVALGRIGEPEDAAPVIAFLLSDEAAWVTGQVVEVSGGEGL